MALFSREASSFEQARQRQAGERRKGKVTLFDLARNGTGDEVRALVATRKLNPNSRRDDRLTPLHLAARFDNEEAARALLELGAKPDIEVDGTTPATEARRAGAHRVLFLLEPSAIPSAADALPWLEEVARGRGERAGQYLIGSDADEEYLESMDGEDHAHTEWEAVYQYQMSKAWLALPEQVRESVGEEVAVDVTSRAFIASFASAFDQGRS